MELNLTTLIALAVTLFAGGFLGVLLGRRSSTANRIVDGIRDRYEREAAELREQVRNLKAKLGD